MLGAQSSKHVGVWLMYFRLQTTCTIFDNVLLGTLSHLWPEWTSHEVALLKVFQPAPDYFHEPADVDLSKILNRAPSCFCSPGGRSVGKRIGRGSSSLCHKHFFLLMIVISSLLIGRLSVLLYTKWYSAQKILHFQWRIRNEDFKMKLLGPRCPLSRYACLSKIYYKIHPSLNVVFYSVYIYILRICSVLVRSP